MGMECSCGVGVGDVVGFDAGVVVFDGVIAIGSVDVG